jgi:hypothetical protein
VCRAYKAGQHRDYATHKCQSSFMISCRRVMERAVDHVIHSALTLMSRIPPSLLPSFPPSQVVELHPTGPAAQSTLISVGEHVV